MRINYKRSQLGMLGCVFVLMAVTMFMAFAGPYSLFNLKQSETSEMKTVIVVARHGDEWPQAEAYFLGEQHKQQVGSSGQLTNAGKERMFLLGKFLKLRYYSNLLKGDSRRLFVRSSDEDKCLESAQLLAAGLNPPQSHWVWSLGPDQELASRWQPKAVHTTEALGDDLLSSQSKCLLNYESSQTAASSSWKNSSKYLQLLTEFRHDLQVLRLNTGLEFEDDLEMLVNIEEHLRARSALGDAPAWYTETLAQRLAHIAQVTSGCKFGKRETQRLYAGRLLDSIARDIFEWTLGGGGSGDGNGAQFTVALSEDEDEEESLRASLGSLGRADGGRQASGDRKPLDGQTPSMKFYVTDKQHLTAILNALKIYSAQPHYGFLLIIELHYDPANRVHFLRLFTVNSLSHNVFPEPVRVNPIACPIDSVECSPEQFELNIRHLLVDKRSWWQQLCKNFETTSTGFDGDQILVPLNIAAPSTTTERPASEVSTLTNLEPPTEKNNYFDKLDQSLIVGPTDVRPPAGGLPPDGLFSVPPPFSGIFEQTTTISSSSSATSELTSSTLAQTPTSTASGRAVVSDETTATSETEATSAATTLSTTTLSTNQEPKSANQEPSANLTTSDVPVVSDADGIIAEQLDSNHLSSHSVKD